MYIKMSSRKIFLCRLWIDLHDFLPLCANELILCSGRFDRIYYREIKFWNDDVNGRKENDLG